jgi:2-dehydropantoate 2-reductase
MDQSSVQRPIKVLIVGVGVIGTVYGAHLAAAGHDISVLAHGRRTREVARTGLTASDLINGDEVSQAVRVVDRPDDTYDLVVVAVRRDQIAVACNALGTAGGHPTVLVFGNNPDGLATIPAGLHGHVWQGFPGIGGTLAGGRARYMHISQQPTTLQSGISPVISDLAVSLRAQGFTVARVLDMDGWLAFHATFVACVAAALYRCGTDPQRLAADRPTLRLMCGAITEGFAAGKASGWRGAPRNLAVLHHPLLRPIAISYWRRTMRSTTGELCFAAHSRRARTEMSALGIDVLDRLNGRPHTARLRRLLSGQPPTTQPVG